MVSHRIIKDGNISYVGYIELGEMPSSMIGDNPKDIEAHEEYVDMLRKNGRYLERIDFEISFAGMTTLKDLNLVLLETYKELLTDMASLPPAEDKDKDMSDNGKDPSIGPLE